MQIGVFLEKFKKIIHDEVYSKKLICETLYQVLKKEISPEQIKVQKGILYIQTDAFVKNQILFKKKELLQKVNMVSQGKIHDIQ